MPHRMGAVVGVIVKSSCTDTFWIGSGDGDGDGEDVAAAALEVGTDDAGAWRGRCHQCYMPRPERGER